MPRVRPDSQQPVVSSAIAAASLLLFCGLGACSQSSITGHRSGSRPVDATAFRGSSAESAADPQAAPAVPPLATPYTLPPDQSRVTPDANEGGGNGRGDSPVITLGGRPIPVLNQSHTPGDIDAMTSPPAGTGDPAAPARAATTTTAPSLSTVAPPAALEPLTLDATVGQINGEPVYADAFFKDNLLEERLRAEATRRTSQREWLTVANDAISKALITRVRDELVLADAYADFTGEKRQGLIHFLTKIQSDEISQRGGSAVLAEQALLEEHGRTLDQEAQNRLEQELINFKINQRVRSRAVVTPRQVRREYERNFNEFNEPSTVHLRLIFMPKAAADAEAGQSVRDALAAGTPFADVASTQANTFNRMEGGLLDVQVRGPLSDAKEILADERLTAAARSLSPGQTVGPIAWGENDASVAWIHLDSIEQGESISLYEAQLGIESRIRDRRLNEERERYFLELLERGSYSDIELMRTRLLAIAVERYWKPGTPP